MPQTMRLFDGLTGLHRQVGRHFERDVAVAPLRLPVDAGQRIGALADVADRQFLEQRARIEIAHRLSLADQLVVIIAMADRLLENRRVGGDPAHTVIGDQAGKAAGAQQLAADKIEPHRLAVFVQLLERVCHVSAPFAPSVAGAPVAHPITPVNPNMAKSSLYGVKASNAAVTSPAISLPVAMTGR